MMEWTKIEHCPRILLEAELTPAQGDRFQPTGFADLGAAQYTRPDGREMLLVESAQSVANRLEKTCLDGDGPDLAAELKGLPYVAATLSGAGDDVRTSSLVEAHRIGSPYFLHNKAFKEKLAKEMKYDPKRPLNWKAIYGTLFKYDPNSLLHGVFLSLLDGGRVRAPRAVTGFIEAEGVKKAISGGVKNSPVDPKGELQAAEADKGEKGVYSNVPYSRIEFTADKIRAYFNLDLALIRGYGLPEEAYRLLVGAGVTESPQVSGRPSAIANGVRLATGERRDGDGPGGIRGSRRRGFIEAGSAGNRRVQGAVLRSAGDGGEDTGEDCQGEGRQRGDGRGRVTTIELKFPAHRFHATPWGRHVNEGAVEWPPSPYRLVRALYDAWKRKHADVPEPAVEELLRSLATEAPSYRLPDATEAHTRSYLNSNTFDPTEKSLIFDAFVAVAPDASLFVTWPNVLLDAPQRGLLDRLLRSLNYVGRSESWIEARVCEEPVGGGIRCAPVGESQERGEMVPVACPVPASRYQEKRAWLEALAYSTAEFQKDRRSLPPAMQLVPYLRPVNAVLARVPKPPRKHVGAQAVTLSLTATVLPLVTATVEIAEQVRVRLMGIHKRMVGDPGKVSEKFSGKTVEGVPLKDHHHAFILPLGNGRGRIDRVLIYTRDPEGFAADEVRAILRVTELYGSAGAIRVMATQRADKGEEIRQKAAVVTSTTPFCPGRHWRKGRGEYRDFLADEIRRECRNHGLPPPKAVVPASPPGLFEWIEFRRNRKDDQPQPGYGFKLEFAEPVAVPFSLGYGCHFGLGQFAG